MLTRLVYYSTVTNIKGINEIKEILEKSRVNNAELSITGMLFFDEKYFIQVLEGDRKAVSEMMLKISHDERHKDVVFVDISEISERKFGGWEMVYAGGMGIDNEVLMRFSPERKFNPDGLSKANFEAMVEYLYGKLSKK